MKTTARKKAMHPSGAIELTTFKLRASLEEFIAANAVIDVWLEKQPGFRSRHMAEENDGTIVDMLLWDSVAAAEASVDRLLEELGDSPIHAMIDQRTVRWRVTPVYHAWVRRPPRALAR